MHIINNLLQHQTVCTSIIKMGLANKQVGAEFCVNEYNKDLYTKNIHYKNAVDTLRQTDRVFHSLSNSQIMQSHIQSVCSIIKISNIFYVCTIHKYYGGRGNSFDFKFYPIKIIQNTYLIDEKTKDNNHIYTWLHSYFFVNTELSLVKNINTASEEDKFNNISLQTLQIPNNTTYFEWIISNLDVFYNSEEKNLQIMLIDNNEFNDGIEPVLNFIDAVSQSNISIFKSLHAIMLNLDKTPSIKRKIFALLVYTDNNITNYNELIIQIQHLSPQENSLFFLYFYYLVANTKQNDWSLDYKDIINILGIIK
jgi:hypothetical protein